MPRPEKPIVPMRNILRKYSKSGAPVLNPCPGTDVTVRIHASYKTNTANLSVVIRTGGALGK